MNFELRANFGLMCEHFKGWEATFLIRAFDLSEELSTEVGFAFSNNCWKSQDVRFRMTKKVHDLFDNVL